MAKILVIIPTYNERENIEKLITAISAQAISGLDILVVDDNSPDGTAAAAESLNAGNVYLLKRSGKNGFGSAYIEGFKWAINHDYDLVIQMDADLSHDPAALPAIIAASEKYDLVIGSRYIHGGGIVGWPFSRKFLSAFGNLYARTVLGLKIKDCTGGYNAWRTKIFSKLGLDKIKSTGYCFLPELKYRTVKNGFSFAEVPIIFKERQFGRSKMSGEIMFEAFWRLVKVRLN